ncbi:MAG: ABC transporter substrate-binding protein [Ruminococcus sp.]|uniref:ABC transporter substrate-binding protein n=1 Tax=Ruminococcus sp. TaxID=41978 RepID=UPI0025D1D6D7|nr:ABC transporter substrate-binding protein [Ruminococcus sp.]MCR5601982.1 ABC transporter substrate-binding protein [Ruminococcus sp.]
MKKVLLILSVIALTSCSSTGQAADNKGKTAAEKIPDNGSVVINLAVCNYNNLFIGSDPVKEFNALDNGYYINIVDYSSNYDIDLDTESADSSDKISEAYANADNDFILDVLYGDKVDMTMKFIDEGRFDSLAEKGAFVDLYTFMENDDTINKDTLNSHVLELCEKSGKLYYMPLAFSVGTMCGYETNVGTDENWTIDEMKERWGKMPKGASFTKASSTNTAYSVFFDFCMNCTPSFIDYDNHKCNFNSDEYIELLKFANSFDTESLVEKEDVQYVDFFVYPVTICGFQQFHELVNDDTFNKPVTFVGYPSVEKSHSYIDIDNTFAICASASPEVQKGAWEFMRYMEGYDYQSSIMKPTVNDSSEEAAFYEPNSELFFPMNNEAFNKNADELISKQGEKNIVTKQGAEYDIGYLSSSEFERLNHIIDMTNQLNFGDRTISRIIYNEVFAMLNGEISPEQAAENIQQTVTLKINE